jgi:hypothetical protein
MTAKPLLSILIISLGLILLSGCASGVKRGVVAMKISSTEAHVGVGRDELRVGDHVELYRNACTGTPGGKVADGGSRSCRKESAGHGEVTQILSDDYSVVQFPPGTKFSEGDMVEKHGH